MAGGLIADRIVGRQVLLVSTVGMALSYGSLTLVTSAAPAIIIIYVAGLFEAAYHPTAFALVGDLKPSGERTHAYGLMRAAGNLGTIIGPLAGAAVVSGVALADVFLASGLLMAAAGVVAVVALPRARPAHLARGRGRGDPGCGAGPEGHNSRPTPAFSGGRRRLADNHARVVGG